MPIVIVPVAIVFFYIITQYWFYRRVRQALVERHADVFLAIGKNAWFLDAAVRRFVWSGRAKAIGDPLLMARVTHVRLLTLAAVLAGLSVIGLITTGLGLWPVDQ